MIIISKFYHPFVHKRILSAVTRIKSDSYRKSYIIL
jgi:hypothetical protein